MSQTKTHSITLKLDDEEVQTLLDEAYIRTQKAGGVEVSKTDIFRAFILHLRECQLDTHRILDKRFNANVNQEN